jgi:phosphoenolpyruvate synthase/pyruvate phosphate dikinase
MIYAMPLRQIGAPHNHYIGGKAFALSVMAREGMAVPDCLCVTSNACKEYIVVTGIGARIGLELK